MKNFITLILFFVVSALFVTGQDIDRVQGGKAVSITAKGIPTDEIGLLSGTYVVDKSSGTIKMPYLDTPLHVVGMTGRQVEDLLSNAYKKAEIFTTPVFVVSVSTDSATIDTSYVNVSGSVGARRNVPYRQGLTLLAAIVDAGDVTDFGSRYIQVTRKGKTETYDYFSTRDRNMQMLPGDTIFVPQRGIFEGRPNKLLP